MNRLFLFSLFLSLNCVQVALVQYSSRAGFCQMVNSKEYMGVFRDKVNGLEDTHTYLTRQIVV